MKASCRRQSKLTLVPLLFVPEFLWRQQYSLSWVHPWLLKRGADWEGTVNAGAMLFSCGISLWLQEIYQEMDHNHTGTIDAHEMRTALKKAGEELSAEEVLGTKMCSPEVAHVLMIRVFPKNFLTLPS